MLPTSDRLSPNTIRLLYGPHSAADADHENNPIASASAAATRHLIEVTVDAGMARTLSNRVRSYRTPAAVDKPNEGFTYAAGAQP